MKAGNGSARPEHIPTFFRISRQGEQGGQGTDTYPQTRTITIGNVIIGGDKPIVIAGPCAVESREQTLEIARDVKAVGANMLRGGAFCRLAMP